MKYSFISRRFVSDSTYESEQEAAPFIVISVLILGLCFWIYTSFINPIIKTKTFETTEIVFEKVLTYKRTELNKFSCKESEIKNINVGDSIKIQVLINYRKFGDSSIYKELIKKL